MEWKFIKGTDWQISENGDIKDNKGKLRNNYISHGFKMVSVKYDKKWRMKFVHRLLAEAFIKDFNDGLIVDFKDSNKSNIKVDNLKLITKSESNRIKFEEVGCPKAAKPIGCYKKNGEPVARFPSINAAARTLNLHQPNIVANLKGRINSVGDYKFLYL